MKTSQHIKIAATCLMILFATASLASAQPALDKMFGDKPGAAPKAKPGAPGAKAPSDIRAKNIFYEPPMPQMSIAPVPMPPPQPGVVPPPVVVQPPMPVQPPAQAGYIGLKYKILLQGPDGMVREVPETFPFRSGQRFRLVFEPNISGYLYIFHKGSNSKGMRLFPEPRINGGRNEVNRYEEIMIPYTGWLRFDETPGLEDLYIFVTPQRLDTFDNLQCSPDGGMPGGSWEQVTAATTNWQMPRPDAARSAKGAPSGAPMAPGPRPGDVMPGDRGPAMKSTQPKTGTQKNIVYDDGNQPIIYTPPVVEPTNWNVNVPASSYVVENAPMLIHHIQMQHHP